MKIDACSVYYFRLKRRLKEAKISLSMKNDDVTIISDDAILINFAPALTDDGILITDDVSIIPDDATLINLAPALVDDAILIPDDATIAPDDVTLIRNS